MHLYTLLVLSIWIVWGLSWLAAAGWSARTKRRESARRQSPYRVLNLAGFFCLFGDGYFVRTREGTVWHDLLPPMWELPTWAGYAMVALALAGLALGWSARLTLGRLWSAAVTRKEGHRIVDRGPYALVRHPIYTALLTGAVAVVAVKGTPISLAGLVLMATGYSLKARVEERFLAAELGAADYAAYRARVPMLIPFAPR